jgi:predicted translin family RNA/ssDNA-binding protein
MKRAIATITVYVYGETEQEQFDNAKQIAQKINRECNATVEKLHSAPFGSTWHEIKEINLENLKK